MKEKKDRVDDAIRATKAAIAEGYVAGGGTAFLRIDFTQMFDYKENDATTLIFQSIREPLKQICLNCGIDSELIKNKVLTFGFITNDMYVFAYCF